MRNVEGDFDPNRLIFVDFDLAAYGARAFDINYHTSYWLPDWGELDFFFNFFKTGIYGPEPISPGLESAKNFGPNRTR